MTKLTGIGMDSFKKCSSQAYAKETQIVAVGAMDNFHLVISLGHHTKIRDPDVGQARGDHQAGQMGRVRDVILGQIETPALLPTP